MPAKKLPEINFNWTPRLAYSVGLITTDGNLSKDERHISLTSSDIQLLKTFKKCLNLSVNITKNPSSSLTQKQSYRVQFGDVKFYRWLTKIGLCPNKTFKLKSLKIPNNVYRDFIRGHLDGDGSIITYIDRYNTNKNPKYIYTRLMVYLMSASQPHVEWLQSKIKEIIKLHGAIQIKKSVKRINPSFVLKFSKKESLALLNWIYYQNNLPCLERKHKIYRNFLHGKIE